MSQSLVRHFMSRTVITVEAGTTVQEAAQRMCERKISCLVVCSEDTPIGIITERDITCAYSKICERQASLTVREIMPATLLTLAVDATCGDALILLKDNAIRRCVLVDEKGKMQGIVTQTDLLRAHARDIEIQKEVLEDRVIARTAELEILNRKLEALSLVDPMLKIGNRRAMDAALREIQEQVTRKKKTYALALIDVDYFKAFNDHYGHLAGDDALTKIAASISDSIRVVDSLYRYGGEEFLVIFPEETLEGASISAERIRRSVEHLRTEHTKSNCGVVTVSIGISALTDDSEHWESVLRRADAALYEAKRTGKNRAETAPPELYLTA